MGSVSTEELINQINEIEGADKRDQMAWLNSRSYVRTTAEAAAALSNPVAPPGERVEIKRNLKLDLILWIVLDALVVSLFGYFIIRELFSKNTNWAAVLFEMAVILLPVIIGYKNLTLKKLTLPIILTAQQITVTGETFQWKEIENTFIVYRAKKFLFVIGFKTGYVAYFDIANQLGFTCNEQDFSALVEHFRKQNLQNS